MHDEIVVAEDMDATLQCRTRPSVRFFLSPRLCADVASVPLAALKSRAAAQRQHPWRRVAVVRLLLMASASSPTPGQVSLPLLENGLDFLVSAVEHLSGEPSHRDLKYALLHLASGIELVLKERLRQHDPAQLYERPDKFDAADFAAGNFKSATATQTVKRLVDLAAVSISDSDRTQLQLLRDKRNRVEHFGFDDTAEAVSAITGRTLGFALDFIAAELDSATLSAKAIAELEAIRKALPQLRAFVADRWQRIAKEVQDTTTTVVACAGCTEEASVLDDGATCLFCGYAVAAEEAADQYAHGVLGASHYEYVHDGTEWVVSTCPQCERATLVDQGAATDMRAGARWVCFGCGEYWPEDSLWPCDFCGGLIPAGEGEMTVCGDCFRYRVESSD